MLVSEVRDRSPLLLRWLLVGVGALVLAGAAPAASLLPSEKLALAGIQASVARGQIDPATAAKDRTLVDRAAVQIATLPPARAQLIAAQLDQVAAQSSRLSTPRALTLFGQLQANELWFRTKSPPADKTDITDAQGVVYRYFPGRGFEFHPLANASALDNAASAKDTAAVETLAQALIARGIAQGGGAIAWEYEFDYAGGRAPWLSGMAQAVFAQAFARASKLLGDASLMTEARAAFRAIPGRLVQQLPEGPWIKLYGFNKAVVLNAQLQTIVSLGEYAGAAEDSAASALASQLEQTTLTDLPRFDSGYWTYYQLPHTFSPLDYQQFVVSLLQKLAPQNPAFGAAATRFDGYDTQPPAFRLGDSAPGTVKLWLSKPASLLVDALGASKRVSLGFGWHTLSWKLPKTAGIWAVHIAATDWAGNTASLDALPLVRVSDVVAGRRASTRVATPASLAQPSFTVGVQLPDPTKAPLAAREHLTTLQVGVQWLGESSPDPAVVASLQQLAAKSRLVVELQPQQLPSDDSGRAALAADVTTLVQQVPGIQDVLLGPVPAPAAAKTYLEALGAIDDAVKPAAPTVRVGAEVDGNTAPQTLLNTYARDIRNEGWTTPPFDELAVRPAAVSAAGVWAVGDYAKLVAAATKAFGTAVPVLWDGVTAPPGLADADQATAYTTLLQTASCQPQTEGVLFATLVDGSDTTGFYASDGTAKASATTLKPVLASAARGSLVACPGLSTPATTSALTFPSDLSSGVQVGCVRDCLYLLTLDDPTGTPVLAARGALTGGAAPATVQLPAATVPPGTYTLTLRLVTQSNPGPVTVQQSAPITTG